jgi:hypothetical protein
VPLWYQEIKGKDEMYLINIYYIFKSKCSQSLEGVNALFSIAPYFKRGLCGSKDLSNDAINLS